MESLTITLELHPDQLEKIECIKDRMARNCVTAMQGELTPDASRRLRDSIMNMTPQHVIGIALTYTAKNIQIYS